MLDGYARHGRAHDRLPCGRPPTTAACPIVCDNSSCSEGLVLALEKAIEKHPEYSSMRIVDAVDFAAEHILPLLDVDADARQHRRASHLLQHPAGPTPTCSSWPRPPRPRSTVPDDWGCCAFAGDRGMLHPELTASATAREAAEVDGRRVRRLRLVQPHLRDRHDPGHRPPLPARPRSPRPHRIAPSTGARQHMRRAIITGGRAASARPAPTRLRADGIEVVTFDVSRRRRRHRRRHRRRAPSRPPSPSRPGRHPGQQRRHRRAERAALGDRRRGVAAHLRRQRARHCSTYRRPSCPG